MDKPGQILPWPPSEPETDYWKSQFQVAYSALAWAVGRLEGFGVATGYAGETFEFLAHPQYMVSNEEV